MSLGFGQSHLKDEEEEEEEEEKEEEEKEEEESPLSTSVKRRMESGHMGEMR